MMERWRFEITCQCGKLLKTSDQEDVHLNFGFTHLCQNCGKNVGSNGDGNPKIEQVRYVRSIPFELLNPATWFSKFKREVYRDINQ